MRIVRSFLLCLTLVVSTALLGAQSVDPFRTRVVAWSPDGSKIAVGTEISNCQFNGPDLCTVQILDVTTQTVLNRLLGFSCAVSGLAWSSDSHRLAASSLDSFGVRVWDIASGELISELQRGVMGITSIDWNYDDSHVVASTFSNGVILLDPYSGNTLDLGPEGGTIIAAKPGENIVASGGEYQSVVYVSNIPGSRSVSVFQSATPATDIDWNDTGTRLAASNQDSEILIWSSDGQLQRTVSAHEEWINSIDWRPNSTQLASAGQDGTIIIWDTTTGTIVEQYQAAGPVYDLSWRPDGSVLAYADGGDAPKLLTPSPVPTATITPSPTHTPTPTATPVICSFGRMSAQRN